MLLLLLTFLLAAACTPTQPTLQLDASGARVSGLSRAAVQELRNEPPSVAEWEEIFPVYVDGLPEPGEDRAPLLGTWSVGGDGVVFTPRWPWVPGQAYAARFIDPASGERLEATYRVPAPEIAPQTEVVALRPALEELPENTLRLYLYFSGPMTRGRAHRHVHLLTEDGVELEAPFVAPEHELWDAETTRLTLLFDPGRIKRGVGAGPEAGAPLQAGRSYRLVVDRQWPDARGAPLLEGFEATFRVGPPDRTQPNPDAWSLEPPTGPEAPVMLRFPEPLDPVLLERLVTVHAGGALVPGTSTADPGGRWWRFQPRGPWRVGKAEIRADPALEDLAGNSLRRAFETPLDAPERTEPVRWSFSIPRNL